MGVQQDRAGAVGIDPSAVVHREAVVDPTSYIGPWCVIDAGVTIGAHNQLLSHVVVKTGTTMGQGNTIYPFAVLGAAPQDLKYKGEPTQLVIGSGNTIREMVTINKGTQQGGGKTSVGDDCLIMAYSHLGHDCVIGNGCILSNYAGLAGHVRLDDGVTLGGMVGIAQFVHIGRYAYVAGQSGLEKDVPPFVIAMGARPTILKGANIVGLKRRNVSTEFITILGEVIKQWTRPHVLKDECLRQIEETYGHIDLAKEFVAFVRSSNGVVR